MFPRFEEGFIMGKVPLGLAYIAAVLKERGHYVEAYNLIVDPVDEIDFGKFDFCGITCLTSFISEVRSLSAYLREKNPKMKIVLGGAHPSVAPGDALDISPSVDFAVAGEGEYSMLGLVESGGNPDVNMPGIYRLINGKAVGRKSKAIENLDKLPFPEQRIFDHGRLEKRNPFRAIIASRGCPFNCFNCQPYLRTVMPFRMRSPESVVSEMMHLNREYGQDYFGFIDSEFPVRKEWFRKFHRLMLDSGLRFSFHCNGRSDIIDEEIIESFKGMNITRLAIGVESGNQRVINDVLNKRIDLGRTRQIFAAAAAAGVASHAHFMIGIPGETPGEMRETLDYAMSLDASSMEFNILTPWPGTRFYELCRDNGWFVEGVKFEEFNEKRKAVVSTDAWSADDVAAFYEVIRRELTGRGWRNSRDWSVYFRPGAELDKEAVSQIIEDTHTEE